MTLESIVQNIKKEKGVKSILGKMEEDPNYFGIRALYTIEGYDFNHPEIITTLQDSVTWDPDVHKGVVSNAYGEIQARAIADVQSDIPGAISWLNVDSSNKYLIAREQLMANANADPEFSRLYENAFKANKLGSKLQSKDAEAVNQAVAQYIGEMTQRRTAEGKTQGSIKAIAFAISRRPDMAINVALSQVNQSLGEFKTFLEQKPEVARSYIEGAYAGLSDENKASEAYSIGSLLEEQAE